jgi:hypothetical protein
VAQVVLDDICATTAWPVGHALVRDGDGPLRSGPIWPFDEPER